MPQEPPPLPQISRKRILPAFLLCFLVCGHRIYAGKVLSGVLQFTLAAGCFVWGWAALKDVIAIIGPGPVTMETVERVGEWEQTHGVPVPPIVAMVGIGIWVAIDAGRLVAGKFTDGGGHKITRWI